MASIGFCLFVVAVLLSFLRANGCEFRDVEIDIGSDRVKWQLCNKAALTKRGIIGEKVSLQQFEESDAYAADCFDATAVPGTVLTNMVKNGMFDGVDDLFVNKNLEHVPDIHRVGRDYYSYYWRTSLDLSQLGLRDTSECDVRLKLRSINYRATLFSNGLKIAPETPIPGESGAVGMFHRWTYPLRQGIIQPPKLNQTSARDEDQSITIAILVEPPDFPGKVTGQQGGDHAIAKNAAIQQYTAGWDWIRGTPDRNTGLWDKVSLEVVDKTMSLCDVYIRTLSNITSLHPKQVLVGVSVSLLHKNPLLMSSCFGAHGNVTISATVLETLEASLFEVSVNDFKCEKEIGDHCETTFQLSPIQMKQPNLWWPHNYGHPHLYHLEVVIKSKCIVNVHSTRVTRFGLRTITTYVDPVTEGRVFLCNGIKIFLQGGNWIGTDQFHRFSSSSSRYRNEVTLHKRMGLNIVRVWGGGITERPEFYEAADEAGVLVLQEFWMTGDNNGRWAGSYTNPLNHQVYLACAHDMILMLRNHASLLLWVGGNELFPAEKSPPNDIATGLVTLITELDPDRFYIPSSTSNYTRHDTSYALAPKDGPYGFLSPIRFYQRNPGLKFWNGTLSSHLKLGFQPEVGASSTPTFRGILKFLNGKFLEKFPTKNDTEVPDVFEFHNYLSYTDDFGHDHIYAYGTPRNLSEYCFQAQLAQYAQVKGLFEGYQRHMWTYYTAMIFWKTQSPWPSFRGFMYDSWLETTGGYWGVQAALEGGQALHIQLGNWTRETSVVIINRSPDTYNDTDFTVSCQWWDLKGKLLVSKTYSVCGSDLEPYSVYHMNTEGLRFPGTTSLGIGYLRLLLHPEDNTVVSPESTYYSFNDYYMSDPSLDQNFASLGNWRNTPSRLLKLNVVCFDNHPSKLVVQTSNPNVEIALQIRIRADFEVEQYFYSVQYFSLLPSETRNVTMANMFAQETSWDDLSTHSFDTTKMSLVVNGLNVKTQYHICEYSARLPAEL